MWLALHAYRRSPAGAEMMNAVAMRVEAAYNVLSGLLPGKAISEATPKGKTVCAGAGTKATNGTPKKGRWGVNVVAKNHKRAAVGGATKSQHRKGGQFLWMMGSFSDFARIALEVVSLNTEGPTPCNVPVAKKAAAAFDLQPVLGLIRRRLFLWSAVR